LIETEILTISGLLNGTEVKMPQSATIFKQAQIYK